MNAFVQGPVRVVVQIVAEEYGVKVHDILSDRRERPVCEARHIAMHVAKTTTLRSYPAIAKAIGLRNHSTVMYADRKVRARRVSDAEMDARITAIEAAVRKRFGGAEENLRISLIPRSSLKPGIGKALTAACDEFVDRLETLAMLNPDGCLRFVAQMNEQLRQEVEK